MQKKSCTILIPTVKRPECLKRILDYYNSFGDGFNNRFAIIIGDSSPFNDRKKNKDIIKSFPKLDVRYLYDYPEGINAHHKFDDLVQNVNTKYCSFCADDDFVIPEGMMEAIKFLEKNEDCGIAHGYYVRFYLSKPVTQKRSKAHFAWAPRYTSSDSISFPDAKSRLAFHMSNYNSPTLYAVHRTVLLKKAYREFMKSEVDPWLFGENMPSYLMLIYGKMKKLDLLYAAKDSSTPQVSPEWRKRDLVSFIENGTYAKNYSKLRKCLVQNLIKQGKIKLEEAEKTVDDAMAAYIARCYAERKSKAGTLSRVFDALGLPESLDESFRKLYRKLSAKKEVQKDPFWKSLDDPSSKAGKELARIRECVLEHA